MSGSPPLQMFIPFQKRHKADNETNRRKVEVLKNGSWDAVRWRDVEVGDVVKVHNDSFFPADMVLLSSRYVFLISTQRQSHSSGILCSVESAFAHQRNKQECGIFYNLQIFLAAGKCANFRLAAAGKLELRQFTSIEVTLFHCCSFSGCQEEMLLFTPWLLFWP